MHKDAVGMGPVLVIVGESPVNATLENTVNGEIHRAATALECARQVVRQTVNIEDLEHRPVEPNFLTPDQVICYVYIPADARENGQDEQVLLQRMTYDRDYNVIPDGKPFLMPFEALPSSVQHTVAHMRQDIHRLAQQLEAVEVPETTNREWSLGLSQVTNFLTEKIAQSGSVLVSEVQSTNRAERNKFILEDVRNEKTKEGASLDKAAVRDECIRAFCIANRIQPSVGDWFFRDDQGELQGLQITYKSVPREHSAAWRFNDPPDVRDLPKIWVDEPRTSVFALEREQRQSIDAALEAVRRPPIPESIRQPDQKQDENKTVELARLQEPWAPEL